MPYTSPFVYPEVKAPLTGTITDIMQRAGDPYARAAMVSGQAWGQAAENIGQSVAALPAQVQGRQLRQVQTQRLQQETQLGQIQVASAQREIAGRQALTALVKQHTAVDPQTGAVSSDHQAIANGLTQAGYPDMAESWLKTATANSESLAKLEETRRAHGQAMLSTIGDLAFNARSPQDLKSGVGLLATHGEIDEPTAHQLADSIDQAGDQWQAIADRYKVFSPKYQELQKKLQEPTKLGPNEKLVIPSGGAQGTPQTIAEGPQKLDEWQAWMQSYPKTIGAADWNSLTPEQQTAGYTKFTQVKQDPALHALALQTAELGNALKQIQLGQQPTKEDAAAVAKQLIEHKLAPSQLALFGGFGTAGAAFKRMVGMEAVKMDPAFDWEQSEADYSFSKSPGFQNTVRYMNSVLESMPLLQRRYDTLAQGKVKSVNALLNAGRNQFNNVDLRKLQTDRLLVADEIAKILQGGGTGAGTSDAKLAQASTILRDTDDPEVARGVLGDVSTLIGYRHKTLTRGTYAERPGSTMSPTAPAPKRIYYDSNGNPIPQ